MSVASVLETAIVLESRYGEAGARELDLLIQRLPIEIKPVDFDQLEWARFAFRTYGRGRHPAKLNFRLLLVCTIEGYWRAAAI
jgi:ribonuclease VapC